MSRLICSLMATATILAAVGAGSSAYAKSRHRAPPPTQTGIQDRYCLQGKIWGYPGNCLFSTYEQCMASASGTYAYCGLNPTYAFREWQGYR